MTITDPEDNYVRDYPCIYVEDDKSCDHCGGGNCHFESKQLDKFGAIRMTERDTVAETHEHLEKSLEHVGETQLDRIEEKLDKVLLFASEMNKVVEGLTPIIADIEQKGIGSIFTMLMGGRKK